MPTLLETRGLTKAFGENIACDTIDMDIADGEIHALLGENGAGKSTLVRMLFGALQPDAGSILWRDEARSIPSPNAARALGIAMVFQHFSLFEALTVAENIALALDDDVSLGATAERSRSLSEDYGLPLDPNAIVGDLSVGERQRVEVVRCLMQEPRLLILDEPTSVLTPAEAERLFDVLRRMRAEGRSVLYISHRLEEVQQLCDRATILRHGEVVDTCVPSEETARSLAARMVGEGVGDVEQSAVREGGATVLELRGLDVPASSAFATALRNVDLTVREGELVCIAGVAGNGQAELFDALSGERPTPHAAVLMDDKAVGEIGINERRRLGAAFVPEERLGHGAVPGMALSHNLLLARHASDAELTGGARTLRFSRMKSFASRVADAMDVRRSGSDPAAASLSGGNLQKYVVGRELDRSPRLLVVNQPTWGVDAGAATRIRQALVDLAAKGSAVLVISQDLDEIFEIATHVSVIAEGRLSPKRPVDTMSREAVGLLMTRTHGTEPLVA